MASSLRTGIHAPRTFEPWRSVKFKYCFGIGTETEFLDDSCSHPLFEHLDAALAYQKELLSLNKNDLGWLIGVHQGTWLSHHRVLHDTLVPSTVTHLITGGGHSMKTIPKRGARLD